jgi:Lar family restriction alleviation protein
MSEELKPCPFCGSANVEVQAFRHGSECYTVRCDGCGALGPLKRSSAGSHISWDLAMEAWNTRHIPEGYALVPVEPTEAMERAVLSLSGDYEGNVNPFNAYAAMITAAQEEAK